MILPHSAQITTQHTGLNYFIIQYRIFYKPIYTYFIQSQHEAILIDPPNLQIFKEIIQKRQSKLKYILFTHYPNEGFMESDEKFEDNVEIVIGKYKQNQGNYNMKNNNINKYKIIQLNDGQSIKIGQLQIIIIHTPGFTQSCSCYFLKSSKQDICVFTGDTVFLGQVGRPDLIKFNDNIDQKISNLYDSLQKIKKLNYKIRIYPRHGSNSLCGRLIHPGNYCTLMKQIINNYGFFLENKQQFVRIVKTRFANLPCDFSKKFKEQQLKQMKQQDKVVQQNKKSFQQILHNTDIPLHISQFKSILKQTPQITIIDTRHNAQQTGLMRGSYWLANQAYICNWIYMILSPSDPYLLVCQPHQHRQILSKYIHVGYINCKGYNNFNITNWDGPKEYLCLRNLQQIMDVKKRKYVDIRTKIEWKNMGVIEGAKLIQLNQLKNSQKEIQQLKQLQLQNYTIIVHCGSGVRARFAASILIKYGLHPIILIQKFQDFKSLGLKIISVEQNNQYLLSHQSSKMQIQKGYQSDQDDQSQNKNRNQVQRQYCGKQIQKQYCGKQLRQNQNIINQNKQSQMNKNKQYQMNKNKQYQMNKNKQSQMKMETSENKNMIEARKGQLRNRQTKTKENQWKYMQTDNFNMKQAQKGQMERKKGEMQDIKQQMLRKSEQMQGKYRKREQMQGKYKYSHNYKQQQSKLRKWAQEQQESHNIVKHQAISNKYKQQICQLSSVLQLTGQSLPQYINRSLSQLTYLQSQPQLLSYLLNDPLNHYIYYNLSSIYLNHNRQLEQQIYHNKLKALQNIYCSLSCLYLIKAKKYHQRIDVDKAVQYGNNNYQAMIMKVIVLLENNIIEQAKNILGNLFKMNVYKGKNKEILIKVFNKLNQSISQSQSNQIVQLSQKQQKQHKNITILKGKSYTGKQKDIDNEIQQKMKQWRQLNEQLLQSGFKYSQKSQNNKLSQNQSHIQNKTIENNRV